MELLAVVSGLVAYKAFSILNRVESEVFPDHIILLLRMELLFGVCFAVQPVFDYIFLGN